MYAYKTEKCVFPLLPKIHEPCLNVETRFYVFDNCVVSILYYASEVWGHCMANDTEKVHLDYCKRLLPVKRTTPGMMDNNLIPNLKD